MVYFIGITSPQFLRIYLRLIKKTVGFISGPTTGFIFFSIKEKKTQAKETPPMSPSAIVYDDC